MKVAVEPDFLEPISPFCTHKGTGGVKAVSAAPAQSRWQAEPQPLLKTPITICGAIRPRLKGRRLNKEREKWNP